MSFQQIFALSGVVTLITLVGFILMNFLPVVFYQIFSCSRVVTGLVVTANSSTDVLVNSSYVTFKTARAGKECATLITCQAFSHI